jgi:phytoene synthase
MADRQQPAVAAGWAIRNGSRSFAAASRLFDPRTRLLVWQLYAWCRHCDDVVDSQQLGHRLPDASTRPADALERLTLATERALAGTRTGDPAFDGLTEVVAATRLPATPIRQHLRGFGMDVVRREYETLEELLDYCYHVAGVVGVMMAWIMGARDRAALVRASDLGIAFQLTNIARDVVDDAHAGRVYLPRAWCAATGLSIEAVADPASRPRLVPIVHRLLEEADRYYESAWYGLSALSFRCAWPVASARHIYGDIGGLVRQRGVDAWRTRAAVGRGRARVRIAQGLAEAVWVAATRGWRATPPRGPLYAAPIPVLPPPIGVVRGAP